MAKIQGLVGGLSGKMGNAVFRQRYGETIVAQYQPVVSNPNTQAQQNARAAFKLITQLSAIMAPAYGTLGVITRPARQGRNPRTGFVAKNYNLIEVDPSPEAAERVTIPMEKLQLTDSFRPLGTMQLSTSSGEVTAVVAVNPDVKSVRFVEVGYISMNGESQAVINAITDVPVEDGEAEYGTDGDVGGKLTILAYGLIPSAEAIRRIDFDNIHTPADEDFISAVALDKMVRDGEMSVTMTMGENITIA